jgi:protein-tyrosine phosphatase
MPNLLFVCTANQFRSPLCAALTRKELAARDQTAMWKVDSAGTWVPVKSGAHPAAIRAGKRLGVDLNKHETREVNSTMIREADLVITMTANQKEALQVEFPEQQDKVLMLTELTGGLHSDIADPAASGFKDAECIASELNNEIKQLVEYLLKRTTNQTGMLSNF